MKNLKFSSLVSFIVLVFIGLIHNLATAQDTINHSRWSEMMADPTVDFFEARNAAQAYFDANPELKEGNGNGYKTFKRWEDFWRTRFFSDSTHPGDRMTPIVAYNEWDFSCENSEYSDWTLIGPNNTNYMSTPSCLGRIDAIYCPKTTNPDILYIGSHGGGIFKTENATSSMPRWRNLTDYADFPVIGITAIAGNGSNIIYAAVGESTFRSYSVGIIVSTDAGETWNRTTYQPNPTQPYSQNVTKILVNPSDPDEVFALTEHHLFWKKTG